MNSSKEGLEVCPFCRGRLVYPTEWRELPNDQWEIHMRCPDCEATIHGTYMHSTVEMFDQALNMGSDMLIRDLESLEVSNFEKDIEVMSAALAVDAILPSDFGDPDD